MDVRKRKRFVADCSNDVGEDDDEDKHKVEFQFQNVYFEYLTFCL